MNYRELNTFYSLYVHKNTSPFIYTPRARTPFCLSHSNTHTHRNTNRHTFTREIAIEMKLSEGGLLSRDNIMKPLTEDEVLNFSALILVIFSLAFKGKS